MFFDAGKDIQRGLGLKNRLLKTRHLLTWGGVVPATFWGTLAVCSFMMGDYDSLTRLVSELGAIGTRTQYIFTAGLLASAILSVLLVVGLCQECKRREISTVPALIILSFSLSISGAAIFPLPSRMHLIMGLPSVLLVLSPLTALLLWRADKQLSRLRVLALVSLAIMELGFTAFMPGVLGSMPGLKQRFFHLGWSLWFIGLSREFLRSPGPARSIPSSVPATAAEDDARGSSGRASAAR